MKINCFVLLICIFLCGGSSLHSQDFSNCEIDIKPYAQNTDKAEMSPTFFDNGLIYCQGEIEAIKDGLPTATSKFNVMYAFTNVNNNIVNRLKIKEAKGYNVSAVAYQIASNTLLISRNKDKKQAAIAQTLGIYITDFNANMALASTPVAFMHNYPHYDVAHATLSEDGQQLYFIADIQGGMGGTDIYVCNKIGRAWSRPENLGPTVNSIYNETHPVVDANGRLYFSSAGHDDAHDVDIFYTEPLNGGWTTPYKLPSPINSGKDDLGFVINEDNTYGYLSSNRTGGRGSYDIYSFTIEGMQNITFAPMTGGSNSEAAINKNLAFANNTTPEQQVRFRNAAAKNIAPFTPLNEIVGMNKVFFLPGKWDLLPETAKELNKLATYLQYNPQLSVEISVHTDARGDDAANLQLSTRRAKTILSYLVKNNISPERVRTLGYGETQLVNHCRNGMRCSNELHEENNRIEVRASSESVYSISWSVNRQKYVSSSEQGQLTAATGTNDSITVRGVEPVAPLQATDDVPVGTENYYKISIGPFTSIDNRTFYECRRLDKDIDIEITPKGKMIVLGPYQSMQEAYEHKNYMELRGLKKSMVNIISPMALPKYVSQEDDDVLQPADYELQIGPFKHVDNNTFNKFAEFGTNKRIEYTSKGMMIVLGPFDNFTEAEQYKQLVRSRASKKTKINVIKPGEDGSNKKRKRKKRRNNK